jgi:hypothetical protein
MVHDLHCIIDPVESVVEFDFSDNQRRCDVENRSTNPHEDSVFNQLLFEGDN